MQIKLTAVKILAFALVVIFPLFPGSAEEEFYYVHPHGQYVKPGLSRVEMGGNWGSRESRPFGSQGEELRFGLSQGIVPRVSLEAWGGVLNDGAENNYGGSGELVFRALDQDEYILNLDVGVGYLLDYQDESAVRFRLGSSMDQGRLNLSSYSLFEFPQEEEDRDETDVILGAAFAYQALAHSRVGVEVVAEDLEGYWEEEEAEGGAKLIAGPTFWTSLKPNMQFKANVSYLYRLTENQPTRVVLGTGPDDSTGLQCGFYMVYIF